MARSKRYQKLLNSKRWWQQVRPEYLRKHPLCELCLAEGKVVAAVDVHHIKPVESAHTLKEMEQLCYDSANNLQALCIPHHIEVHQDMRSHTTEGHQQRQADRLEQWKDKQRTPRKPTPSDIQKWAADAGWQYLQDVSDALAHPDEGIIHDEWPIVVSEEKPPRASISPEGL